MYIYRQTLTTHATHLIKSTFLWIHKLTKLTKIPTFRIAILSTHCLSGRQATSSGPASFTREASSLPLIGLDGISELTDWFW